jgi:fucose permease
MVLIFIVSSEWSMNFWGASFLQSKLHFNSGSAAALLAFYLITEIAGRLIGSRLTQVIGGRILLLAALSTTLLGFAFFWLAPTVLLTAAGLFLTGLSISNLWPQALTLAFETVPGQLDQASARVSLGSGLAITIAPLLLGTLANTTGLQLAYGIEPCLLLAAMLTTGIAAIRTTTVST